MGFYVDYIPPWMKNTNAELKKTTLTTADSLAIREQYNKGPSNGVSDTPKASEATDPDLRIDDDERQATLKPDQQKAAEHQQKLIEDDFNDRKNEIFDEVATLDVRDEHTQAILDEVTAMADEAVADVKQAKVFHDAAKIAASCLKGLPHE
ncbi:MAG: hypothetical protein VX740_10660 [Pseudomonadota bacterium]|nr:hypothetical protein [Pseudomonadota bacterium]